jgi:UDP-glucose 4-epimerase
VRPRPAAGPAGSDIADPAFNIATATQTSVRELAEIVGRVMGRKPDVELAPARAGELFRSSLDVSKARRVLGWKPEVRLDDGLPELVDWFRKEGR